MNNRNRGKNTEDDGLNHCGKWFNLIGYLIQEEKLDVNLIKMFENGPV
ncbi:hypothetical protein JET18_20630 [Chryseobacterium sp. L7]|uniref:Uncharacterized protein n=1 Tax=Chryseobacterium endalhagicum TaxID=2797638 RepID=A0ABS1QKW8_9FLAO|nr:hypothetical protein [Chryseobacterium endalhagicum]MBL1223260.1 hypothetical protein [Chryseobacterium endalhagicum]